MEQVDVFKALSNKTRLQILAMLKVPEKYFPPEVYRGSEELGICVGKIQEKCGLSQSTVSEYLSVLQRAGLVTATRMGQWTYCKRNEEGIKALAQVIQNDI